MHPLRDVGRATNHFRDSRESPERAPRLFFPNLNLVAVGSERALCSFEVESGNFCKAGSASESA